MDSRLAAAVRYADSPVGSSEGSAAGYALGHAVGGAERKEANDEESLVCWLAYTSGKVNLPGEREPAVMRARVKGCVLLE